MRLKSYFSVVAKAFKTLSLSLCLSFIIIQLALGPVAQAADTPQDIAPLNRGDGSAAVSQAVEEIGRALNDPSHTPQLSEAEQNGFFLAGQTVVSDKGREYHIDLEHYGEALPRVPAGVLERKLVIASDNSGITLTFEGTNLIHKIPLAGETLSQWSYDWDNDVILIRTQQGSGLIIEMSSLRQLLFKYPIPVFRLGKFETTNTTLPQPTRMTMAWAHPENFDFSPKGRALVSQSPSSRRWLVATADQTTVTGLKAMVEKSRYLPLAEPLQSSHPHLQQGDVLLIGPDASGGEQIVGVIPRESISKAIEEQGAILQAAQRLLSRDDIESLVEMGQRLAAEKEKMEQWLNDPKVAERLFQQGFFDALRNVPAPVIQAIIDHAKAMAATNDQRTQFTAQEWQKLSQEAEQLLRDVEHSAQTWRNIPSGFRSAFFSLGESYQKWKAKGAEGLGNTTRFLANYRYHLAGATAIAAAAVSADQLKFGGNGLRLALDIISVMQTRLISLSPIFADAGYLQALWTRSIPGQVLIPAVLMTSFAVMTPFAQRGFWQLMFNTGVRAFARIQGNPVRLLALATGQTAAFEAAKEGEFIGPQTMIYRRNAPNGTSGRAKANQEVTLRNRKLFLANLAASVVAGLSVETCPGILWSTSRPAGLNSKAGVSAAIETRSQLLKEMEAVTPEEWVNVFSETSTNAFAEAVMKWRQRAISIAESGAKETWWNYGSRHIKTAIKLWVLKNIANYSEETFLQLADANFTPQLSRQIGRHFIVDYLFSLFVATHFGKMAGYDLSSRHFQEGKFLSTHPVASTENLQQVAIGTTRGAASDYLTLAKEWSSANRAHIITADLADRELVGYKPLLQEMSDVVQTMFNFEKTQPGNFIYRTMKNGRVRLAQSTFMIGFIPWLLIPCVEAGSVAPLAEPGTYMTATFMQCMFMARALWSFAWPVAFTATGINVYEEELNEKYELHSRYREALIQAQRIGANAETIEQHLQTFINHIDSQGNLTISEARPEKNEGETAKSYSEKIVAFYLEHPAFARKSRTITMVSVELFYSFASTVLAYYMYIQNAARAMSEPSFFGVNWHDWDIITHIPEGDGILGIAMKSTAYTYSALGLQLTFNWLSQGRRLKKLEIALAQLEARLRSVDESERSALEAEVTALREKVTAARKAYEGAGNAVLEQPPIHFVGSAVKETVRTLSYVNAELRLKMNKWLYDREQKKEQMLSNAQIGEPVEWDTARKNKASTIDHLQEAREFLIAEYHQRDNARKNTPGGRYLLKLVASPVGAVKKFCATVLIAVNTDE